MGVSEDLSDFFICNWYGSIGRDAEFPENKQIDAKEGEGKDMNLSLDLSLGPFLVRRLYMFFLAGIFNSNNSALQNRLFNKFIRGIRSSYSSSYSYSCSFYFLLNCPSKVFYHRVVLSHLK
jgi:hypothetical protein